MTFHTVYTTLLFMLVYLGLSWCVPDKIKIDPKTRLYVSRDDGRVRVFHGLALENNAYPNALATYTDAQIELLKTVS